MAPFSAIPFAAFFALWTIMNLALLVWLAKPWPWIVPMLILPIIYELCVGNIHFLLAAVTVVGIRWAVAWPFAFLTKITPGVGSLWFVGRGEWRRFALALGATAAIVAVSYALSPQAWQDWFAFLTSEPGVAEWLPLRVVAAAAIVLIGARKRWGWTIAVAAWLCHSGHLGNAWGCSSGPSAWRA